MNLACRMTGDIGRVQVGFRAWEWNRRLTRKQKTFLVFSSPPLKHVLKIQLSDGELALGSPEFFLFFSLSTVHWYNSYIEAFYLDKLVTEKRAFVLLIFFKNKTVAILNFWLAQIPRQILDNQLAFWPNLVDVCDVQENNINSTKAIAWKINGTTEKAMAMSLFWVQLFPEDETENGRTIDFVRQRYLNFCIKIKTSKNPTQ